MSLLSVSERQPEEEPSFFQSARPYIEKLMESREGLAILSIIGGLLVRMTSGYVLRPGIVLTAPGPDINPQNPRFKDWFVFQPGLDLVIWKTTLPFAAGGQAELATSYISELGKVHDLASLWSWIWTGAASQGTPSVAQTDPFILVIRLSDVLIWGGMAALGVDIIGRLIPKL